jgi:glycosyltransferase involved in cell wall biosynthesis
VAKLLEKKYKKLKFVVLGSGTDFPRTQLLVKNLGLSNLILTGWVPYKDVPEYINACDIGIALRANNMANNFVVTTALMQYYACKKPVIAPGFEAIKEICKAFHDGSLVDEERFHTLSWMQKTVFN